MALRGNPVDLVLPNCTEASPGGRRPNESPWSSALGPRNVLHDLTAAIAPVPLILECSSLPAAQRVLKGQTL